VFRKITEMQVRAFGEAGGFAVKEGVKVLPEIMIRWVGI
jgi:hypothetical protein